jgi:hypothetical protein
MTIKHLGGIFGRNPTFNDVTIDGGIYIGGEASGNYFDDYEEGTWTPTVTGTTSGSATVSTIAHANYTKIGNVVIARCYIVVDFSSHTVSGDVQIGGLPFSAATNNEQMSTITYCNWTTADEADITLSARVVTSNARLLKGSSQTAITNSDLISSSGGTIMFGMIYKA